MMPQLLVLEMQKLLIRNLCHNKISRQLLFCPCVIQGATGNGLLQEFRLFYDILVCVQDRRFISSFSCGFSRDSLWPVSLASRGLAPPGEREYRGSELGWASYSDNEVGVPYGGGK